MYRQNRPAESQLEPGSLPTQRLTNTSTRLSNRAGRMLLVCVILLMGIVLGVAATLLSILAISDTNPLLPTSVAPTGNIVVQADPSLLTHLAQAELQSSGLPGTIKNVQVQLTHGDQVTINGDDEFTVLFMKVTRSFTLQVQPYVSACQLQIHVVSAHFASFPVTAFATAFESQINQKLRSKLNGLPGGLTYCTASVRTEPTGLFITYTATPG
jgi:hypothetical protein